MIDTLTGRLGPREIALAFAFGILLGLLPKANLLFALLAVLFFLSHANLVLGLVVTLVVTLFSPWVHPLSDEIGAGILTSTAGQQWGATLFKIPLFFWTHLDNTVVLGSFVLGLVLFIPVYLVVWVPLKIIWPRKKEKEPEHKENSR